MTHQNQLARLGCLLSICLVPAIVIAAEDDSNEVPEGWKEFVNPVKDCKLESTKSKITITAPEGNHDLHPRRGMNAPRLLKEAEGDFIVQVKVSGDFKPGEKATEGRGAAFNGAGLLIWNNKGDYLRLERNAFGAGGDYYCFPPLIEFWRDGKYVGFNSPVQPADDFFKGRSTWLRVKRQGVRLTASYSHDGKEWTDAKEFIVDFPHKVSVGVSVLNTTDKSFSAEFEEFEVKPIEE